MRRSRNVKQIDKKKKKIGYFKILTVFLVGYFLYTMYSQQVQINKYNSQIEMYKSDITIKTSLVDYYKSQKSNAKTDEYIESVAREQLGYVKPYEKIFIDINK
jgi:cell division protein FtsB